MITAECPSSFRESINRSWLGHARHAYVGWRGWRRRAMRCPGREMFEVQPSFEERQAIALERIAASVEKWQP